MEQLPAKVSIIGAGSVGVRFTYALIIHGLAREVVLVDTQRQRLEAEVMDLSHGAPYVRPVNIVAGDYRDIQGSGVVVITAGKKQLPGQTRLDLAKENADLFKKIIPEVIKYAPEAIIVVVTNPVDVLAYITYKISGKPSSTIMSSGTVLDTARFRYLLSCHCKIAPQNIHAYILGEHGDTEFAVWSRLMIGGVLIGNYCKICPREKECSPKEVFENIFNQVVCSAYKIIEGKGETSYGIGLALVRIVQAIVHDENAVLPVSTLVDGFLDERDVFLSLPAIVNKNGVRGVLELDLSEDEKIAFRRSAEKVRSVIKECGF
ncbi:MAG: L-lactate dehydrogenase [Candidatus Omnitrophica bacterium]|nr:L-lactate dehydrogenase [Candidatus Omnitrophota bacterium]